MEPIIPLVTIALTVLAVGALVVCVVMLRRVMRRAAQLDRELQKEGELVGVLEKELRAERASQDIPIDRRAQVLAALPRLLRDLSNAENYVELGTILGRAIGALFDPEQWMVFLAADRISKDFLLVSSGSTNGECWEEGACLNDQMGRLGLAVRRRRTMDREDFFSEPPIVVEQVQQTEPHVFMVDIAAPLVIGDRVAGVVSIGSPTVTMDIAREGVEVLVQCAATAVRHLDARKRAILLENRDDLTGLHNRNWFKAEAPELLYGNRDARRPMSLLIFAIDDLKGYAERQGPAATEELLRGVAEKLRMFFREGDLLARWADDEFVALLSGLGGMLATGVLDRVRRALSSSAWPGVEQQPSGVLTLSAGLAIYGEQGEQLEDLLDVATRNLGAARTQGGDRTIADAPSMGAANLRPATPAVTAAVAAVAAVPAVSSLPPVAGLSRSPRLPAVTDTLPPVTGSITGLESLQLPPMAAVKPPPALRPQPAPAAHIEHDDEDDDFVGVDEAPAPPAASPLHDDFVGVDEAPAPPAASPLRDEDDLPGMPPQPPLF